MAQGNYDHPSYLTRQMDFMGTTTAGASGTSLVGSYPIQIRFRQVTATVKTAGTSTGAAVNVISLNGTTTTTLGSVSLSTNTANTVVTSADLNTTIPVGALLYVTNGTDATSVANVVFHYHIDPSGTWVGSN